MRKFADIFAFCNNSTYREIIYFEQHLVRSTVANFEDLSNQGIANVTKNHDFWANMTMSFTDIKSALQSAAG